MLQDFLNIKLSELAKRQFIIFERYDNLEESFPTDNPEQFIRSLDKYMLHVIEEVYEYYESNFIEGSEVIDIFNYLLTILSILYHLTDDVTLIDEIEFNDDKFRNTGDVNEILHDINHKLILLRRLFPERKWHTDETEAITERKISQMINLIVEAIHGIFLLCSNLEFLGITDSVLISVSESKIQKIMNKKDRKGISS